MVLCSLLAVLSRTFTWLIRRQGHLCCDSLQDPGIGTAKPPNAKLGELYQVVLGPSPTDHRARGFSRLGAVTGHVLTPTSPFQSTALWLKPTFCARLCRVWDVRVHSPFHPMLNLAADVWSADSKILQNSWVKLDGHHAVVQNQKWRCGWTLPWGTV